MTGKNDIKDLTLLGQKVKIPERKLETFPNHSKPGDLKVVLRCNEFTCRCPVTHQPDWAQIEISYVPNEKIVESKSVKLYLETFREEGIFHEHLAQVILNDFVNALDPITCSITVKFNIRGGISIDATASYEKRSAERVLPGNLANLK